MNTLHSQHKTICIMYILTCPSRLWQEYSLTGMGQYPISENGGWSVTLPSTPSTVKSFAGIEKSTAVSIVGHTHLTNFYNFKRNDRYTHRPNGRTVIQKQYQHRNAHNENSKHTRSASNSKVAQKALVNSMLECWVNSATFSPLPVELRM